MWTLTDPDIVEGTTAGDIFAADARVLSEPVIVVGDSWFGGNVPDCACEVGPDVPVVVTADVVRVFVVLTCIIVIAGAIRNWQRVPGDIIVSRDN